MAVKKLESIQDVRNFCMRMYKNGGDAVIEYWKDADIQAMLDQCAKRRKSVRKHLLENVFALYNAQLAEHQADISVIPTKASKAPKAPGVAKAKVALPTFAGIRLTDLQVRFVQALKTCQSTDHGVDSVWQMDILTEGMQGKGFGPMTTGAMVSTLREKSLLFTTKHEVPSVMANRTRKVTVIELTDLGKQVVAEVWSK
jgi:hypothetical protein